MNVGLRQLRAFVAVASRGSFSRAAEDLGLSQSAASVSVRQLEAELGLRLLDRTTRQVRLTAVGETFLGAIRRLIDEIDATLREAREVGVRRRGRVRLSSIPSAASRLLPRCLIELARLQPEIEVAVDDEAAVDVVRRVDLGEVDFGIASGPLGRRGLHAQHLVGDPFCLVCRRDHPLALTPQTRWRDLAGETVVMLNTSSGSRALIERSLAEHGVDVRVRLELTQPSSVAGMVEAGVGISVMPEIAAPPADHPVLLTRILVEPEIARTIILLRRSDRSLSPAAEAVWDTLLTLFSDEARSERAPISA